MSRGGANIDVIIPSDYMIARMIEEDMLAELDFSNIPNFALIDERYKGLEYDPDDKFSVAYMTGTVGLIYNSAMISEPIISWSALFDSRYEGQILMFNNPRDTFGIALKYLGYSLNTTNEAEIHDAFGILAEQNDILQAYVMDQIFDKLESGEAWLGPYYAGDFLAMVENNPDLRFVRPYEGTNFFVDAMCIPIDAENKTNAELFINFMSRTDIALMNMEYIYYASANYEAAEIFADELDPEDYAIMFASSEVLANSEMFSHLPRHIRELYDELWVELKQ
jgi:spermidine/putrescine transport system substrate-binding protein